MAFPAVPTARLLHQTHRFGGLFLAFFILFYCLTGIILNHRQAFEHFTAKEVRRQQVTPADPAVLTSFIDHYKKQLGRQDNPAVIRIRDNQTIEFLYGSHGQTTFSIDPTSGVMEVITKRPRQPLYWLNKLHKAFGTGPGWLLLTDLLTLLAVVTTISIMMAMKYRAIDFAMLAAGVLITLSGVILA